MFESDTPQATFILLFAAVVVFQGLSWKFILGALVVALGSLVTSVILTARN